MVYMICKPCKISYHSPCLPVGDEYVPQRQLCPRCGECCQQTDIVYYADEEMDFYRRRCASRLTTLNIIKARFSQLYELADWTGQDPLVKDWAWQLNEIITTAVYDIKEADRKRKAKDGETI